MAHFGTGEHTLLLYHPFRHVRIDDVATVSDRLSDGTLNRTGFSGSRRSVQSEDSAFLAIEGQDSAAEIPAFHQRASIACSARHASFSREPSRSPSPANCHRKLEVRPVGRWLP
jgi:hypothetical protein